MMRLIFVYNADSGLINTVTDYWHKIIRPSTYRCSLCTLTFGNLGMKDDWKRFIEKLEVPVEFLHKDEFMKKFDRPDIELPSALVQKDGRLEPFITKDEMNDLKSLDELKKMVAERLKDRK